ncbi:PH domain-containing protein [Bacillus sp. 1P06AnD]|uniref:PH domain-containing protein n=1 Tax=Bacillus sp. 1P06AnD TaxID=3132208 RepID=UPI0039A16376
MMNERHRFHPAWMLFEMWSYVKGTFFIILFLFIFRFDENTGWVLWAKYGYILLSLWMAIYIFLKWTRLQYAFKKQVIVFYEGVFVRKERTVPIDKIQNQHTQTNILHRLLGLTSLTIETGTTAGESSIEFKVISKNEYEKIMEYLLMLEGNGVENQPQKPEAAILFRSTMKDNVKASFTSLSFLAIFPILLAIYSKVADIVDLDQKAESVFAYFGQHLWFLVPLAIIALMLSSIIGFVQTLIKYGNYEISSDKERIYLQKGMLRYSSFSIQKDRVQAIEIRQSLLKRLFGMAEIKMISAGNTGNDDNETNSLYPFMPKNEAYKLVNELLPMYEIEEDMLTLPKKILWLRLLRPYYVTFIALAITGIWFPAWLWIPGVLFMLAIISRVLDFMWTGYSQNGAFMQIRKGGFTNETFLTRVEKIQEIEVRHSWLQRLFHVATIEFNNRAKPIRVNELKDLSAEEANEFFQWFRQSIEIRKKPSDRLSR